VLTNEPYCKVLANLLRLKNNKHKKDCLSQVLCIFRQNQNRNQKISHDSQPYLSACAIYSFMTELCIWVTLNNELLQLQKCLAWQPLALTHTNAHGPGDPHGRERQSISLPTVLQFSQHRLTERPLCKQRHTAQNHPNNRVQSRQYTCNLEFSS